MSSTPHTATPQTERPLADRLALERLGAAVRKRLAADPSAHKVAVDGAEIFAFGQFLTPAECAKFVEMVDKVAQPSATFDQGRASSYRTSYSGDVNRREPFVQMIERRLDDLLGIDPAFGETIQGQRYTCGQEFKAHHDWFYTDAPYWAGESKRGGQRSWTAMIYLSDVEEGGETTFPRLGVSVTPEQGALLVWNNASPNGAPNLDTLHAATPVVRGVKYVITKWYRTRKWS